MIFALQCRSAGFEEDRELLSHTLLGFLLLLEELLVDLAMPCRQIRLVQPLVGGRQLEVDTRAGVSATASEGLESLGDAAPIAMAREDRGDLQPCPFLKALGRDDPLEGLESGDPNKQPEESIDPAKADPTRSAQRCGGVVAELSVGQGRVRLRLQSGESRTLTPWPRGFSRDSSGGPAL